MDRSVSRIGAGAGWLALAGILAYHIGLSIVAGQRVSGTTDLGAINAYYSQPVVAWWGVEQFLVLVPLLVFIVAMRETLAIGPYGRLLTGVALVAAAAEAPVILTQIAVQAALVSGVQAGQDVGALFRLWDVLYNSGAYVLEATWVLAFGLAMRPVAAFPRFTSWLSPLTALLLGINVFAIWVGIPDVATLPSAFLLGTWLAGASIGLRRVSTGEASSSAIGARSPSSA